MLSVEKVPSNTVLYRTVRINKKEENNNFVPFASDRSTRVLKEAFQGKLATRQNGVCGL
jgi:hypothetical protein